MAWIPPLLTALGLWFAIGLIFALPFAARGVNRLDPAAAHAPVGFRLLIVPGCAALWPLLFLRWLRARRAAPASRAPHEGGGQA